jgi:hypothetical protein
MNKGIVNIVVLLAALLVSSACGTTNSQQFAPARERPILSAAETRTMIRVEVRVLEPITAEQAVVVVSD